jgi:phage terminase small subunit
MLSITDKPDTEQRASRKAGRPPGAKNRSKLSPLEYMLKVLNDPKAEPERRDRMAIAAAQYVHAKRGYDGSREGAKERAQKASEELSFAPAPPPRLVANAR